MLTPKLTTWSPTFTEVGVFPIGEEGWWRILGRSSSKRLELNGGFCDPGEGCDTHTLTLKTGDATTPSAEVSFEIEHERVGDSPIATIYPRADSRYKLDIVLKIEP